MSAGTPLPWTAEQIGVSDMGPDGVDVFDIGPCDRDGDMRVRVATVAGNDATYIVTACNAYPKLVADRARLIEALDWISKIALANYEQDNSLRANGARTLKRIGERADAAIRDLDASGDA